MARPANILAAPLVPHVKSGETGDGTTPTLAAGLPLVSCFGFTAQPSLTSRAGCRRYASESAVTSQSRATPTTFWSVSGSTQTVARHGPCPSSRSSPLFPPTSMEPGVITSNGSHPRSHPLHLRPTPPSPLRPLLPQLPPAQSQAILTPPLFNPWDNPPSNSCPHSTPVQVLDSLTPLSLLPCRSTSSQPLLQNCYLALLSPQHSLYIFPTFHRSTWVTQGVLLAL